MTVLMKLLFVVVSCLTYVATANLSDCFDTEAKFPSEEECLKHIEESSAEELGFKRSMIPVAMHRGWWGVCAKLTELAQASGVDVKADIDMALRVMNQEGKKLKETLNDFQPLTMTINPAFRWAQSRTHVFLEVKFAHKIDAPAALNVREDKVNILPHGLEFSAVERNRRFVLNVDLFKEINPEESTWSFSSVGRATFQFRKSGPDVKWARLYKTRGSQPSNMHTWWNMLEKYEDELDELEEEIAKAKKENKSKTEKNKKEKADDTTGKKTEEGGGGASAEEKATDSTGDSKDGSKARQLEEKEAEAAKEAEKAEEPPKDTGLAGWFGFNSGEKKDDKKVAEDSEESEEGEGGEEAAAEASQQDTELAAVDKRVKSKIKKAAKQAKAKKAKIEKDAKIAKKEVDADLKVQRAKLRDEGEEEKKKIKEGGGGSDVEPVAEEYEL